RERELAEARAGLALLEGGNRPREIEAERARLGGLGEEERYLHGLQNKLAVCSPVPGVVTTPRLREKVGQFVRDGELLCVVEAPECLGAELAVPEEEAAGVGPGQEVGLKPRGLPFETVAARVDRVAATTESGEAGRAVTVYCRVEGAPAGVRPGATGY